MKRYVLSTTVQSHTFDIARELQRRGLLTALFSGYSKARLRGRGLDGPELRSFPAPGLACVGIDRFVQVEALRRRNETWPKAWFDASVARALPTCDVFLATSSNATKSGPRAQAKGALWVCDRPCSHILHQDALLTDEYARQGKIWPGIAKSIIDRELREYEAADAILVASKFAERSFLDRGFAQEKIWRIPYGVDVSRFRPGAPPAPDRFDVLFAGQLAVRKGLSYLFEAFKAVDHPRKKLTLVGLRKGDTEDLLAKAGPDVEAVGALPQARLAEMMSQSHAVVLPSVEDGFGLVVPQALACGCPIIVSDHAGAADVVEEGVNGYVVPARDVSALTLALQKVATHSNPEALRANALQSVSRIGGWDIFVDLLVGKANRALS